MIKNDFWIITLCVFLIMVTIMGLNLPLRIALAANAVIILIEVAIKAIKVKRGNIDDN